MEQKGLSRKMGFWSVWALGVGAVVGDGIFLLVADGAGQGGPACLISYLIAGLLLMCVCMNASELAVGMPVAGSMFDWNNRVLGARWGMIAAFGNMGMNLVFLGSVSLGMGYLSNYFFMFSSNENVSAVIWALLVLVVVYVVTLLGGDVTGKTQLTLIAILVGIMVIFVIASVASGRIEPENYKPFAPFGGKGVWLALCAGTYTYMGPLSLLTTAGEVKDIKILPKAMFWAFVTIIVLYISSIAVVLGVVHYTEYSTMASPFTIAAEYIFGSAAGIVINLGAWIACITCLIGEMFTVSRLLYGMSLHGIVPKCFAKTSKKNVPHIGLTFGLIIGILLIFMGILPQLENAYVTLCNTASACGVTCMFVTVIASYVYKKKFADEYNALVWKLPCKNLICAFGIIGSLILFWSAFSSSISTLVVMLIYFAIILLLYQFYSKPHSEKIAAEKANE